MRERCHWHIAGALVVLAGLPTGLAPRILAAQGQTMALREIRQGGIVADYFYLEAATKQWGILLLGGSEGGKVMSNQLTYLQDMVDAGGAVLSLAYFKEQGLPRSLQSIPLEYFAKATEWLLAQPETRNDGVIVLGGSKGAEAALLYAGYSKKVRGVIGIVPSAYVFEGIVGRHGKLGSHSSWSYRGKDIPYVPYVSTDETWIKALRGGGLITVHREALADPEAKKKAAIAVEKIKGPILLVSAKRDRMWPSAEMAQVIMERLAQHEFPYPHKHLCYDVGHNVIMEASESWPAILKFMKDNCLTEKPPAPKPTPQTK